MEESLAHFRAIGDIFGTAAVLARLSSMAAQQGDERRARGLLAESLAVHDKLGTRLGIANVLMEVAALVARQGQQREKLEGAARLYGAVEALSNINVGADQLSDLERAARQRTAAMLQSRLGEATFAAAWAEGRAMTLEQAVAYAREQVDER